MGWQSIETCPKDQITYFLVTDGVCMPDVVIWLNERPARTDKYGTYYHAIPEGWFNVSRSRITNPKWWMPMPPIPS